MAFSVDATNPVSGGIASGMELGFHLLRRACKAWRLAQAAHAASATAATPSRRAPPDGGAAPLYESVGFNLAGEIWIIRSRSRKA